MRIVCIDDESLALRYIESLLSKIPGTEVIGTFTNPLEGKEFVIEEEPDVVFLDIDMSPINGMEIAEKILEKRPKTIIVFVTAYEEYAVEAFELDAIDYILKPLRLERFKMTIKRIRKELQTRENLGKEQPKILRMKTSPTLTFEASPENFEPIPWRTAKSEELFIHLLQNNGVVIEKSAIIELLWPDNERDKAYSLLYTTIYNIRKQLKAFQENLVLQSHSHGYMLELKDVEVDQKVWLQEVDSLPALGQNNRTKYKQVLERYRGPYYEHYDYTWLEPERYRLEQKWIELAYELAIFYKQEKDFDTSIYWFHQILDKEPTLEDIHFQLMKLYNEKGDFTAMMQQYNLLHRLFREQVDAKPSEYIKEWYVEKLK